MRRLWRAYMRAKVVGLLCRAYMRRLCIHPMPLPNVCPYTLAFPHANMHAYIACMHTWHTYVAYIHRIHRTHTSHTDIAHMRARYLHAPGYLHICMLHQYIYAYIYIGYIYIYHTHTHTHTHTHMSHPYIYSNMHQELDGRIRSFLNDASDRIEVFFFFSPI
jgi:hypothetical protein